MKLTKIEKLKILEHAYLLNHRFTCISIVKAGELFGLDAGKFVEKINSIFKDNFPFSYIYNEFDDNYKEHYTQTVVENQRRTQIAFIIEMVKTGDL